MHEAIEVASDHGASQPRVSARALRTWRSEPTSGEVLALAALACLIGFVVISVVEPFWDRVRAFGDSAFYVDIVRAIRRWDFSSLSPWHFWGLPYIVTGVAVVTSLSEWWSLLIVCISSALGATFLMHRLWGGWVAGYFLILSLEWQQRALLGGSEPLFVFFLLASFSSARRERWSLAALFASLATIVRPLGVFLLLAIGIVLLARKAYGKLAASTAIGVCVGAIYVLPLVVYFGDPFANFRFYQTNDWANGSPIGLPFVSIISGAISFEMPWTSRARAAFWILFYVVAAVAMLRHPRFRDYARRWPVEPLFAAFYLFFLFSYNSPVWAWVEFARYSLPALPIALYALDNYLPRDRRLLWALTPISAALSAVSAMNARRVLSILRSVF